MRRDPVAELSGRPAPRPVWKSGLAWLMVFVICVSLAGLGLGREGEHKAVEALKAQAALAKQQASEARARTQQLQDVICGVYVPIGNATVSGANSVLGKTIVAATRHGAARIHCPGLKP